MTTSPCVSSHFFRGVIITIIKFMFQILLKHLSLVSGSAHTLSKTRDATGVFSVKTAVWTRRDRRVQHPLMKTAVLW